MQGLIFDSQFDQSHGVVSSIRIMQGKMNSGSKLTFIQAGAHHEAIEIGTRRPVPTPVQELGPGEVGYLIAGIKDVGEARSGETVTTAARGSTTHFPAIASRCQWCSPACSRSTATTREPRKSLEKLKLNTPRSPTPRVAGALGFGTAAVSSGCCHMEIVKERSSASSAWH